MKLKIAIGSFLLFLVIAVALLVTSREPEFSGRGLSSWLGDMDYGMATFNRSSVSNAEHAVRQIGPRAVPTLVSMMRYRDSSWWVRFKRLVAKQKIIKVQEPLSAEHVQWRGARGVWVLGPTAQATIPDLILLLTNQSTWVRGSAAMALGKIGTNAAAAIPALIKNLDDSSADVRNSTALGLREIGPAANAAVPALARHFTDPDFETRLLMMSVFLSMTNDTSAVLPHLIRQLSDGAADARGRAAGMLSSMGRDAQSAAPELRKLLNDPDRNVRYAVTNALSRIEGAENQITNAHPTSFRLQNTSSKNVLEFYGSLVGKRVEIAPEIRNFTPVTIISYEPMTIERASRLVEEALSEQANIILVPGESGVIVARPKPVK